MSGMIALAAGLKDSKITHLKYVWPSSASHALCFLGYGTEPDVSHLKLLTTWMLALSLANNFLKVEGGKIIAEAIVKMPQLISLK